MLLKSTTHSLSRLESLISTEPEFLFREIRKIGLSEYGLLLESQPFLQCPNLSKALSQPTSIETQKLFTGGHGHRLLLQSIDFVRHLRSQFLAHSHLGKAQLPKARILDYGCGWGRLLRLMYFYFDQDQLVGVDPWQKAIDECHAAGLGPNIQLIDRAGKSLADLGVFDAGYAFSVFTHLPSGLMKEIMGNIRRCMKDDSIFVITVRPPEYWEFRISQAKTSASDADVSRFQAALKMHAAQGYAFDGHGGSATDLYGDSSIDIGWFEQNLPEWEALEQDRSLNDPLQVCVTLRARSLN